MDRKKILLFIKIFRSSIELKLFLQLQLLFKKKFLSFVYVVLINQVNLVLAHNDLEIQFFGFCFGSYLSSFSSFSSSSSVEKDFFVDSRPHAPLSVKSFKI